MHGLISEHREASEKFDRSCSGTLSDFTNPNPSVLQSFNKAICLSPARKKHRFSLIFERCVELEQKNPDSESHRMVLAACDLFIGRLLLYQGDSNGMRATYEATGTFLEELSLS